MGADVTRVEGEANTHAASVQLAKDNLAIDEASVRKFSACRRLSHKADAGIRGNVNDGTYPKYLIKIYFEI